MKGPSSKQFDVKASILRQWRLEQGGCAMCPASVFVMPLFCFDADHVERIEKVNSVSVIVNRAEYTSDDVHIELGKCRMLCANCHRKNTHVQMGYRHAGAARALGFKGE
jgi:hypothetical protein